MITGFNTDIEHNGTVYHVQTEDKGLETPFILSLVYVGGAILASKRSPYTDLVGAKFDASILNERLQRQHKLICAAISAGRIEDLKRLNQREPTEQPARRIAPETSASKLQPDGVKSQPTQKPFARETVSGAARDSGNGENANGANGNGAGAKDNSAGARERQVSAIQATPLNQAITASGNQAAPTNGKHATPTHATPTNEKRATPTAPPTVAHVAPPAAPPVAPPPVSRIAPPPAPSFAAPPQGLGRSATLETIPAEIDDALHLSLLEEKDFRAGEIITLRVMVSRGAYETREAVREASVTVKILGTEFRPLILTSKTDADGVAVVHVWLPRFTRGRAAILVRATADGCSAELRRVIHHT